MKLLIQSAMIFFGTLMAAAVVALGEPGKADVALASSVLRSTSPAAHRDSPQRQPWLETASMKAANWLR